ncbi:MAG TPA: phospholipase A [Methylophilaceae bacterium]|nr:phospholipase A [Methylophilaceae bacterium]HQC29643.1 phospholipase A [Methylotenera sp.]
MNRIPLWVCVFLFIFSTTAHAQSGVTDIEAAVAYCKTAFSETTQADERLSCFDRIQLTADAGQAGTPKKTDSEDCKNASDKPCRYLDRKWRLSSSESKDLTDLETHGLNYLVVTKTSNPNHIASSPRHLDGVDRNLDNQDLKFQVSFKTELMRSIPFVRDLPYVDTSRIWTAYTQQSYWQVFDGKNSRPMREHNFSPEIILSLGLKSPNEGERQAWLPRMANLGFIHESNGRSMPISRSWNRFYIESAWEINDNLSVSLKPWWRVYESGRNDDNPDIAKFIGYGDMKLHWDQLFKNVSANLLFRNNFRSDNKAYTKLDLQYQPFDRDNIKLHLMLSDGYGESLIDYNHAQTVFGFGVSIGE